MKKLYRRCPKCSSHRVSTERRLNGDSTCGDCTFKGKTKEFDRYEKESENKKPHIDYFDEAARPLIKFLNEHFNPHTKVIVTPNSAEILSGEMSFHTDDYIKD